MDPAAVAVASAFVEVAAWLHLYAVTDEQFLDILDPLPQLYYILITQGATLTEGELSPAYLSQYEDLFTEEGFESFKDALRKVIIGGSTVTFRPRFPSSWNIFENRPVSKRRALRYTDKRFREAVEKLGDALQVYMVHGSSAAAGMGGRPHRRYM